MPYFRLQLSVVGKLNQTKTAQRHCGSYKNYSLHPAPSHPALKDYLLGALSNYQDCQETGLK